jgi:hypothetical protein
LVTKISTARPETPLLHGLLVYRVLGRPLMSAALVKPARDHEASTGLLKTEESRAESKELVTQEEGHAGSAVLVTGEEDDAESEALE